MTNQNKSIIAKNAYLIVLGLLTFYYCLGSVAEIYTNQLEEKALKIDMDERRQLIDGKTVVFRNKEHMEWNQQYEVLTSIYPTFDLFGPIISYILSLISFGILGAIIKILVHQYKFRKSLDLRKIFIGPLLGGAIGFMVLVLADFLPEFKLDSGEKKFYYATALIAGMFSEKFFEWLRSKVYKVFSAAE